MSRVLETVVPQHQPLNLNCAQDKQQQQLGGCVITARLISDSAEQVIPHQPAHFQTAFQPFRPVVHPKIGSSNTPGARQGLK